MCACVSVGGCVRVTVQEGDRKSERERERERGKQTEPRVSEKLIFGDGSPRRSFAGRRTVAEISSGPRIRRTSNRRRERIHHRVETVADRDEGTRVDSSSREIEIKKSVRFTFPDRFSSSAGATKIFSGNGRPETSARSLPGAAAAAHSGRQR